MNAIDTLRDVLPYDGNNPTHDPFCAAEFGNRPCGCSVARRAQARDALAKLETLLRAAEPCADWTHITREDSQALAAAIRDVKGDGT